MLCYPIPLSYLTLMALGTSMLAADYVIEHSNSYIPQSDKLLFENYICTPTFFKHLINRLMFLDELSFDLF